jgi:hypothetical protein
MIKLANDPKRNSMGKKFVVYSGLGATVIIAALLFWTATFSSIDMRGTQDALADGTSCISLHEAREKTYYDFVAPPNKVGDKDLRCIQSDSSTVVFAYSSTPLTAGIYESVETNNAILVKVSDPTLNGTIDFNAASEFERTFNIVNEKRPDLKPQLLTINGYPAWGREGGPDAGIVVIEDAEHQEILRKTEPAPAMLDLAMGNIGYSLEGFVPLSELIEVAKTIR